MEKILVVGSSVVDLTFYSKHLPHEGETVTGRFQQGLGGKGFNQAVAASLSGSDVRFITSLGALEKDPFSNVFIERLKELGIESRIAFCSEKNTGAAAILVDEAAQNKIVVSLGANENLSPSFLEANEDFFKGIHVLVMQFEIPMPTILRAIQLLKKNSPEAKVILNPAPAFNDIPGEVIRNVDFLTPNESELSCISGTVVSSEKDVQAACERIYEINPQDSPKAILATLGEKGCVLFSKDKKGRSHLKSFPAFSVKAVDTSGAGDAFNGGLASGWIKARGNTEEAIRFASAVAALSVTKPGTSSSAPEYGEILRFMNNGISQYPQHWWQPIHDSTLPEWEILPQAALPGEVILSKRNELGLLSNFSHTPFEFHGVTYNSIEGFWQMMFYPESPEDLRARFSGIEWPFTREHVSQMESHEAFAAGMIGFENMKKMGINYVTFEGKKYEYWVTTKNEHYALIVEAMKAKLRQNPRVAQVLVATQDLRLRADHYEPVDAPPSWKYYDIWMELRAELLRDGRK